MSVFLKQSAMHHMQISPGGWLLKFQSANLFRVLSLPSHSDSVLLECLDKLLDTLLRKNRHSVRMIPLELALQRYRQAWQTWLEELDFLIGKCGISLRSIQQKHNALCRKAAGVMGL